MRAFGLRIWIKQVETCSNDLLDGDHRIAIARHTHEPRSVRRQLQLGEMRPVALFEAKDDRQREREMRKMRQRVARTQCHRQWRERRQNLFRAASSQLA